MKENSRVEVRKQHNINVIASPPSIAPWAVPRCWPRLHSAFIWTYRATGSIKSLHSSRGSTQFIWKQSSGARMLVDGKRGKKEKREKVKIGGKGMKNEPSAERTGNEGKKTRNQVQGQKDLREKRKTLLFTFYLLPYTLQCRRCHPRRCRSTHLPPPLPGRSLWKVLGWTGWH